MDGFRSYLELMKTGRLKHVRQSYEEKAKLGDTLYHYAPLHGIMSHTIISTGDGWIKASCDIHDCELHLNSIQKTGYEQITFSHMTAGHDQCHSHKILHYGGGEYHLRSDVAEFSQLQVHEQQCINRMGDADANIIFRENMITEMRKRREDILAETRLTE